MRVTTYFSQARRIAQMLQGEERLQDATDRVTNGQRISRPSDDPGHIGELLRTRSEISDLTRRKASVDTSLPFIQGAESTLGQISSMLLQIKSAALQASNTTTSADQRQILGDQVARLR